MASNGMQKQLTKCADIVAEGMEQRTWTTQLQRFNLGERCQKHRLEERQALQQIDMGKLRKHVEEGI